MEKFAGTGNSINDKRVRKSATKGSSEAGNEEVASIFKVVESCANYQKMPAAQSNEFCTYKLR